jgi:O-acetyl-ADP-ribose deacetylase (regulator of RNase III)
MIRYTTGDILNAGTDALVNTVNSVGVMGRGIALQFKHAFPANFRAYAAACAKGLVQPGQMFVYETGEFSPRFIINFPTKRHWRGKSRVEDIEAGLVSLVREISERHIRSVAIPPLGSGLGGLDWRQVRPLVERAMSAVPDVEAVVFEPNMSTVGSKPNRSTEVPRMTTGRAALIGLMSRYLGALMDPSISLLEVHKLMYFLQAAGEPLRLDYVKAPFGPYAQNLRHVLKAIDGHLIDGYVEGDAPEKQLTLVPGATDDAESFLEANAVTQDRFSRVVELVEGFETAFGLELLATVHWVASQEGAIEQSEVERKTYEWGERKAQFTSAQIRLAFNRLRSLGWLDQATRT